MGKKSIYITKECPLIVYDNSDTMEYDTVFLDQGGYIELRAGSRFTIDKLVRESLLNLDASIIRNSSKDKDCLTKTVDWQYDIIVTSTPGKKGSNGADGGNGGEGAGGGYGGDGANGNPGGDDGIVRPNFTLVINDLQADISVLNIGGLAGDGGNGGNGGDGGDGDSNTSGGRGGDGGDGGNGGNGGKGCNLTIEWNSSTNNKLSYQDEPAPGGKGGKGGLPGRNGKGYTADNQPKKGNDGNIGMPGAVGKTTEKKI